MTDAAEIATKARRNETRNRWLLSAPALLVILVAATGPLLIVLVYSFLVPGPYGDVKWQFSTEGWTSVLFERDMFDDTLEPGWAPMTASGLAQWGPPATADFLGLKPGRESIAEVRSMFSALRKSDNEFDLTRLRGLLKVANS